MSEVNQKLPSTASAAVIANTAALNISLLRASFNLRKDTPTATATKPSKYAALVRRAEQEDLKIPQYNVGIGGRPDSASAAKLANDDLRRKLMLDRKRGADAVKLAGQESSDEEEGRSALGRSKKAKRVKRASPVDNAPVPVPVPVPAASASASASATTGHGDMLVPRPAQDKTTKDQDYSHTEPRGNEIKHINDKEAIKTAGDALGASQSKGLDEVEVPQAQEQGPKKKNKKSKNKNKNKNKNAAATATA